MEKLDQAPKESLLRHKAETLRKQLPKPVLVYYERCRTRGRPPVAVIGNDGICSGCQVRASRGLMLALQRGAEIQVCDNCGGYLLLEAASQREQDGFRR